MSNGDFGRAAWGWIGGLHVGVLPDRVRVEDGRKASEYASGERLRKLEAYEGVIARLAGMADGPTSGAQDGPGNAALAEAVRMFREAGWEDDA